MSYIFKRDDKYLSERYEWGNSPNAFAGWQKDALESMFSRMTTPPTHYAVVSNGVELDRVEWLKIGA